MLKKEFIVDREILFFAFRYSLGRMTYASSIVTDNIKSNISKVSKSDIEAYIKEINECEHFGMQMDKDHWLSFRDFLENELKNRG